MIRKFTFKQVLTGFILNCEARHLSPNTIKDYANSFRIFQNFMQKDYIFAEITSVHIQKFLASFDDVTNSTLRHYYSALSAMWTWAVSEKLVETNIVQTIKPPKPEEREIMPFTEAEVRAMLAAAARSKAYVRPGKSKSDHATLQPERARAIILMLLDTGLRADELMSMKIFQVDQRNHRVQIMGKGSKQRSVPFSPRTAQALWRYLATRPDAELDENLFITANKRKVDPTQLNKMLKALAAKAGVKNVHPHRFRHTMAIEYLRNGGDPYTLQRILGHSTLEMVKRYIALAQVDIDKAHKRASPVDNWTL